MSTVISSRLTLLHPLGRGTFATVWRGDYNGAAAAVKVYQIDVSDSAQRYRAFIEEVHSLASFDHPSILQIHDFGTLESPVGDHPAGAPYIVTELADGGSLAERPWPAAWPEILAMVDELLAATAHMHARDVVHRDLKPGNVLWCSDRAPRPGMKVADFSIAHGMDRVARTAAIGLTAGTSEAPVGTPRYAAPEQRLGKWRDYGPWTDVYAVGVLVAELCGRPCPEDDPDRFPLPRNLAPLRGRTPLPAGFSDWLARATATRHAMRFSDSRAAREALAQLGPPEAARDRSTSRSVESEGGVSSSDFDVPLLDLSSTGPAPVVGPASEPIRYGRIRPLAFWDCADLVGEVASRMAEPGVARIVGDVGAGRRALARHVCHRLRETDPASCLLLHDYGRGPREALIGAIDTRLRLTGLPAEKAARRLVRFGGQPLLAAYRRAVEGGLTALIEVAVALFAGCRGQGVLCIIDPRSDDSAEFIQMASRRLGVIAAGTGAALLAGHETAPEPVDGALLAEHLNSVGLSDVAEAIARLPLSTAARVTRARLGFWAQQTVGNAAVCADGTNADLCAVLATHAAPETWTALCRLARRGDFVGHGDAPWTAYAARALDDGFRLGILGRSAGGLYFNDRELRAEMVRHARSKT